MATLRLIDAGDRWLHGRTIRGEIMERTAYVYRQAITELADAVGDIRVRRLGRRQAHAWLEATAQLAPSTRLHRHSILCQFGTWLVDEGHLDRNPFPSVKPPKPPRRPPRALPADAVGRLLAATRNTRDRLIVLLMVQQGLRCVGVANLRAEDVDLIGRTMRVREKFGHERTLPITDECFEALMAYLAAHPVEVGPLVRCWKPNGKRTMGDFEPKASDRAMLPETISKLVSALMRDSGVKFSGRDGRSAHSLRHTCATDMLAGGADLLIVRDTLGHTSLATTQVYLSVQPGRLAAGMGGRTYG